MKLKVGSRYKDCQDNIHVISHIDSDGYYISSSGVKFYERGVSLDLFVYLIKEWKFIFGHGMAYAYDHQNSIRNFKPSSIKKKHNSK